MKYTTTVEVVQGDNLPSIRFQIRDRNTPATGQVLSDRFPETWRPVSIAGAAVYAQISEKDKDEVLDQVVLISLDLTEGIVALNVNGLNFMANEGEYEVEITVVYSGMQQTVYDRFLIDVRKRIAPIVL